MRLMLPASTPSADRALTASRRCRPAAFEMCLGRGETLKVVMPAAQPSADFRRQAPWQRLNFLPLPHQHGSLRPRFFSRSLVTRCWVITEPPPASSAPAVTEAPSPPSARPAPPPAAAIACEPASDSCAYAN